MLATGCRIGEALALRYGTNGDGKPILDLGAGTWEVNATVVGVPGVGLTIQPRPKTNAGWRVIALPGFAVHMLKRRRAERGGGTDVVFTSPMARMPCDPTNVSGDLRQLLDSFECEACSGTGYQLGDEGSFALGPARRRVGVRRGRGSWVTPHTLCKTVATRRAIACSCSAGR